MPFDLASMEGRYFVYFFMTQITQSDKVFHIIVSEAHCENEDDVLVVHCFFRNSGISSSRRGRRALSSSYCPKRQHSPRPKLKSSRIAVSLY